MSAGTSSVLPNNTYANPIQELWAQAGSGGGGGNAGVTQIVAGTNITITPADGEGVVTINASGAPAGGVTEILTGPGISASAPTGVVTLENTGVTSLVAGNGISVSGASGAVTVSANGSFPPGDITINGSLTATGQVLGQVFVTSQAVLRCNNSFLNTSSISALVNFAGFTTNIQGSKFIGYLEPGAMGAVFFSDFPLPPNGSPLIFQHFGLCQVWNSAQGANSNFTYVTGNNGSEGQFCIRVTNNNSTRTYFSMLVI